MWNSKCFKKPLEMTTNVMDRIIENSLGTRINAIAYYIIYIYFIKYEFGKKCA